MTTDAVAPELVLRTDDYQQAHEHVTQIYIPHRLRAHEAAPLDFRIRYLESERFTIGHLRYGADSELIVPPMQTCYHVNLTLHGRSEVSQGTQAFVSEAQSSGVVFTPNDPFTVRWSPDAIQYAVKIPRWSLESQLESLIGRPVTEPVRFDLGFSLESVEARGMLAAVAHMRDELSRGGAARFPLVRAQLESYVISQLLAVMSHEHRDAIEHPHRAATRRHVDRARDFIQEHIAEPITVADVARAVFVSVRALQASFREEVGISPKQYIDAIRMERAFRDLVESDGTLRVQEVAFRWGYGHMGRFSQQFRRRYGILPSSLTRR